MIGDVVAVGSGVTNWHVGDRVGGAWHGGHDGTCKACNRGLFQMCDNAVANGINRDGGCKFEPSPLPFSKSSLSKSKTNQTN